MTRADTKRGTGYSSCESSLDGVVTPTDRSEVDVEVEDLMDVDTEDETRICKDLPASPEKIAHTPSLPEAATAINEANEV